MKTPWINIAHPQEEEIYLEPGPNLTREDMTFRVHVDICHVSKVPTYMEIFVHPN